MNGLHKSNPAALIAGATHPLFHPALGDHPLPTDPAAIGAVLQAGRRCRALHPYLSRRYGQRGVAFTGSDGGYLVTLTRYPQSHVNEQVFWLAGLLARRGLPRWLMQQHLLLLHEELCRALPEQAEQHDKLRNASQQLAAQRLACLSQDHFDALVARFADAVAHAPELAHAAELLVAAVCDECCGLPEAVPSLTQWLADPARFSAAWCAAVADTLAQARAQARPWLQAA